MPQVAQGDVFSYSESVDLLILFGHRGFNALDVTWRKFRERFPSLDAMSEPFTSFDAEPHEYAPGKFIVTVAEESNHGMSDDQLLGILEHYFSWAKEQGLRRVATNGIMDTDHAGNTDQNRASDDRRAQLIIDLASAYERKYKLKVSLLSLNDVFVRGARKNMPQSYYSAGESGMRNQLEKADYVNDGNVIEFAAWLRKQVDVENFGNTTDSHRHTDNGPQDSSAKGILKSSESYPLLHHWTSRRTNVHKDFRSLQDAFHQYAWPIRHVLRKRFGVTGPSFSDNKTVLDGLQSRLRNAVSALNENDAKTAARDIQTWGGTLGGNVAGNGVAIDTWPCDFAAYLNGFRHNLSLPTVSLTHIVVHGVAYQIRSNAGFTKIHSLLLDDFIIYDSRVAAALGFLVVLWCKHRALPIVPAALDFSWMNGQGMSLRNPSCGPFQFSPCGNDSARHLSANLRANWLLGLTLGGNGTLLRPLEAALFELGYDLSMHPLYGGRGTCP